MVIKKKTKSLGTLEVRPCKGRELRVVQKIGKQDPFLQFELGNSRQRTKADKNGGQKPTWNERLTFDITEGVHKVVVKCYDQNLREHAFIGESEVDFSPAITHYQLDSWFELKDKGEPAGEVYLEFTFFPVDGQKHPPPLPYISPFTPSPIVSKTGTPIIPLSAPTPTTPIAIASNQKDQPLGNIKPAGSPISNMENSAPRRSSTQPIPTNTSKPDLDRPSSSYGTEGDMTPHIGSAGPGAKPLPTIPPPSRSNSIYSSNAPSQNSSPQPTRHNIDSSEHAEQSNRTSQYSEVPPFVTPYPQYPYPMSHDQGMYIPGPYYPDPYAYGYPVVPGTPFPPVCPDPAAFSGYPVPEGYMPPYPDMPIYDPGMFPDHFHVPEEFLPPMGVYCDEYGVPLPPPPMDFMPYPAMVPPGCYMQPEDEKQK
ncbi:hypothetical protein K7432_003262 [Basidiobolus ranarum]|uniref:C2 domain-containing protein n=1 Tax=Basidiobolus ranarum TaxID=34480 RepID=A0ABR2W6F5_9FUNG